MQANPNTGWLMAKGRRKQSGQALIYGLFMLTAGLSALFFLFNVGQLTREKTKLVNTADAVAYSAGVMHARALNFAAYTNRSFVANETAVAQMISLVSWGEYMAEHGESTATLGCETYYNVPVADTIVRYGGMCIGLFWAIEYGLVAEANEAIRLAAKGVIQVTESAKTLLQAAQGIVYAGTITARDAVMQEVAESNYAGDGKIQVDLMPLPVNFEYDLGPAGNPIMDRYAEDRRKAMADMASDAVKKDTFTPERNWKDKALVPFLPCTDFLAFEYNKVEREGNTKLDGFDDWVAKDKATYTFHKVKKHRFRRPTCDSDPRDLGNSSHNASEYGYSGIPSFVDLSESAKSKDDPRVKFAVRLMRRNNQTATSDARSDIKNTPRLNRYTGAPASDVYVGLSASEAFFSRPVKRQDGRTELANLFNPYWQTHLMEVPDDVRAAATALQGVAAP